MPDYRITKQQFGLFKREVLRWIREFGLMEYDVEVRLQRPAKTNASADTEWSMSGRWCIFRLAPVWPRNPIPREIKYTAFHEVMHLLLAPMCHEGMCRYTSRDTMDEVEEGIVVRLENFFRRVVMKEKP